MKLGDILISHGAIDQEKLEAALSDQRAFGGKLGRTLVDLGYLTEEKLVAAARRAARALDHRFPRWRHSRRRGALLLEGRCLRALRRLPGAARSQEGRALAGHRRAGLEQLAEEVAQLAQLTLEPMLAPMSAIDRAVRAHYYGERGRARQRLGEPISGIPLDSGKIFPAASAPKPRPAGAPGPVDGPAAPAGPLTLIAPASPRQEDPTAELRELLVRLERAVSAQGRAFRSLVELLQEKGIVRRGELGARTSKKPGI